jgi:AcrR family transcriptional regulator
MARLEAGERTREAIIEAAFSLFLRQGYHGTSMRQIAKRAGIALGGIYNHFGSKEDVFREVFMAYHPYHEVVPALAEAEGDTLEEVVRNAYKTMMTAIKKRPDFMQLIFIELLEFKSTHTQEIFDEILPFGIQIAERVKTLPPGIRDIPPMMVVRTFLGLFFSYFLTHLMLTPGTPRDFTENDLEYFVDVYLHGIMAGE